MVAVELMDIAGTEVAFPAINEEETLSLLPITVVLATEILLAAVVLLAAEVAWDEVVPTAEFLI